MARFNLLREQPPLGLTCIYFPIYFNNGYSYIWLEVRRGKKTFYAARKVKDVFFMKEN